jgi:antitoxin MazE
MNATIQKWGNSLALRIPKSIAVETGLGQGDSVELQMEAGALVVRPARPRYRLADLLRGITAKNRHSETEWGKPKGRESW